MDRIANFVYDKARLIIAITLILSVAALASFSRFELDPDFMSFFYKGNPKSAEYNYLSEKYENGEPISILVVVCRGCRASFRQRSSCRVRPYLLTSSS